MPWCDTCSRYYNPNSMPVDGSCPQCGKQIAEPQDVPSRAPWHFKVLIVAAAIYLGWRFVQGIQWLLHHV
jgi:hypothetical protein